jgi:hypothetical protein
MRLIIVWATVEDVQTHPRAAKIRRQPERIAILFEIPELACEVAATTQLWLVVVWATIENVQAHTGATKQRRQAIRAVAVPYQPPELARDVLIRLQSR